MKKIIFFMLFPLMIALIANFLVPTRKLIPISDKELGESMVDSGSGLTMALEKISEDIGPLREKVPLPASSLHNQNDFKITKQYLDANKETDQSAVLNSCKQFGIERIELKEICLNNVAFSSNLQLEEKTQFFKDEIEDFDCKNVVGQPRCQKYLTDCLRNLMELTELDAAEFNRLVEVISNQSDNPQDSESMLRQLRKPASSIKE